MSSPWKPAILGKYIALQVPGWLLLFFVMSFAHLLLGVPSWVIWASLALLVIKDAVLYPFLWRSFEASATAQPQPRAGAVGTVDRELAPTGYIRVRGELWRATLAPGERGPLPDGARVHVTAVEGMTLIVRPEQTPER